MPLQTRGLCPNIRIQTLSPCDLIDIPEVQSEVTEGEEAVAQTTMYEFQCEIAFVDNLNDEIENGPTNDDVSVCPDSVIL